MTKTLLEAPGTTCPALKAQCTSKLMKAVPCGSQSHTNGFCKDHQYVHRILTAWAEIGYAALDINEHYKCPGGSSACQEIALLCPAPGTWFGFTEQQNKRLLEQGRKDRYTQIVDAIALKSRGKRAA